MNNVPVKINPKVRETIRKQAQKQGVSMGDIIAKKFNVSLKYINYQDIKKNDKNK